MHTIRSNVRLSDTSGARLRSAEYNHPTEAAPSAENEGFQPILLVVDGRALERECLSLSLASAISGVGVVATSNYDEWLRSAGREKPKIAAVLMNIGARRFTDVALAQEISHLVKAISPTPLVVLADTDEVTQVLKALEYGAKGYIPTSVGISVCTEAIALARAGGVFVPGSTLIAMRKIVEVGVPQTPDPVARLFTSRQGEVLEALRRGKANKIIAHELDLKESTVKVHIRHIMKKLKASNRTEAVYRVNDLLAHAGEATEPSAGADSLARAG